MEKPRLNQGLKIILKFQTWHSEQQDRGDGIGDLACMLSKKDLSSVSSRRKENEHKSWSDIVISISEPGYIAIFNDAWQEFELAKHSEEDSLD